MPEDVTIRDDGGQRGDEALGGGRENAGVDSPGHNLSPVVSRPLFPRLNHSKRTNSICSCDFTSETHPQSLGLGGHLSAYCLELSLCDYLD